MAATLQTTVGGIALRLQTTVGGIALKLQTTVGGIALRLQTTVGGIALRLQTTVGGIALRLQTTVGGWQVNQRMYPTLLVRMQKILGGISDCRPLFRSRILSTNQRYYIYACPTAI